MDMCCLCLPDRRLARFSAKNGSVVDLDPLPTHMSAGYGSGCDTTYHLRLGDLVMLDWFLRQQLLNFLLDL
jgi:hypothetical protein